MTTRTYDYRSTKAATIWIGIAIACVVAIITLYNQLQMRAQVLDNLSSASNAIVQPVPQVQRSQPGEPACYNGGTPVYDPVKCIVPTATSN
jgi:hypothetical protein